MTEPPVRSIVPIEIGISNYLGMTGTVKGFLTF